jgi:virginiamycin B lyase
LGFGGGGLRSTAPVTVSPSPTLTSSPSPSAGVGLPTAIPIVPDARIAVQGPIAMAQGGTALWILGPGRLDRLDPKTNALAGSVQLGSKSDLYNGLAASATGLWATDWDASVIYRADPTTLRVVASVPAQSAKGVLITDQGVWLANTHAGTVTRLDPATNRVVDTITVGPAGNSGPNWLASGLGSIWVDVPNNGSIARIDPRTRTVQATIPAPLQFTPCGGFGIGTTTVWVTACSVDRRIARIDPTSNAVSETVELGGFGQNPTMIDGAPWVAVDPGTSDAGYLVRIDPATTKVDRVLKPSVQFGGGGDIVVADGSVWVLDGYNNAVLRLPMNAFGP